MNVSIVCPAYNEELGIKKVLSDIKTVKFLEPFKLLEVIVVNNNSTDLTEHVAKKLGARVVFEKNKGYGYAYKTGISHAKGDVVVTLDADGTYPVSEINNLLKLLLYKNLDFVNANRFGKKIKNMETLNFIGNKFLTFLFKLLYNLQISDSQSGMWVFYKKYWNDFNIKSNQMAFSQEIKIEALYYLRLIYDEYPIDYNQREGSSKLNVFKDGAGNLFFLIFKRFKR